jgi:hypothetical protein
MKTNQFCCILAVIVAVSSGPQIALAQHDQRALAQQLTSGTSDQRAKAIQATATISPDRTGPELRLALFEALSREGKARQDRAEARRLGSSLPPLGNSEVITNAVRAVARFNDPRAIPALTQALGTGFVTIRTLAAFGEDATDEVLQVVMTSQNYNLVRDGLITLRFMVENQNAKPLSDATKMKIRHAAKHRLRTQQYFPVVWHAIDLATTTNDPELIAIVRRLSSDREAVRALGITKPDLIAETHKRAADRIAGKPALPRWQIVNK